MWKRVDSKRKIETLSISRNRPTEIVVPFTNDEIDKLQAESKPWQRACSKLLERFIANISKAREFNL